MRNWSLLGFSISLFHSCVFSIGNGVNLQPSYYNNGNVTFGWELMKSYPQIKSVRIEIEPDKVTQGKQWIDQARSNGYEIIATYHNYNVLGSDDSNELLNAANWWKQNYAYLSNGGPITVNIMNEWGSHNQDMYSYSNAYNQAISIIRSVYSGYLILDIPGWGQETLTASKASPLINDKNIIFSAHVYSSGWNQAAGHSLRASDLDVLKSTGRPCMIGEFGTEGSGPVNVEDVVNHAKELGFPVLAWAWNSDGGGMNMVSPTWSSQPTSSSYAVSPYFWDVINFI